MPEKYFLDTHALIYWDFRMRMSEELIDALDEKDRSNLLFTSICVFWEVTLLHKKGRVTINDVNEWSQELKVNTNLQVLTPRVSNFVDSVQLPLLHKDPFDRLFIAQAKELEAVIITKDKIIPKYDIQTLWKI